jgi:hypothetical protein
MRDEPIHERITALNARTPAQTVILMTRLMRSCESDRTQPAALAWVRQWRPQRLGAVLPECTCGHGRCVTCN